MEGRKAGRERKGRGERESYHTLTFFSLRALHRPIHDSLDVFVSRSIKNRIKQ